MSTATSTRRYAVIAGLGRTGLSCARHLHAQGWRLAVTDTRPQPPELGALRALAGVEAALALAATIEQLVATPREVAHEGAYEVEGVRGEDGLVAEAQRAPHQESADGA